MRRSATPWRLYLLTSVTWVLLALVGAPDTARAGLSDDAVVALRQAADRTLSGSFRIDSETTYSDGEVAQEAVDYAVSVDGARQVVMLWREGDCVGFRAGDRGYEVDPTGDGRQWVRFDARRATHQGPEGLRVYEADRWLVPRELYGVVIARRTGPLHYSGVLDLTRSAPARPEHARLDWTLVAPDPTAVPFEATLDARGRLVELTEWRSGAWLTNRLSEHGRWLRPPTPPDRDVSPAGDTYYG
ncbi:MAG TPA: hypothetical protein VGP16_21245 [Asanoa sp.]|jgi:hypothetical protein|nr:hypothetical protein [Asanoa sp.]